MDTIGIVNSALTKVGALSILSLDDDSRAGRICKLRFDTARQVVLRMHPWNCAMDRALLAPLNLAPSFGWENQFQLPSNFLRVHTMTDDVSYVIEGKRLLCDLSSVQLRYVFDQIDVTQLDVLCAETIALYLAWDMAYAITQSQQLKDDLWTNFVKFRSVAKSADAQEESAEELEANTYIDGRLIGTTDLRATPKRKY